MRTLTRSFVALAALVLIAGSVQSLAAQAQASVEGELLSVDADAQLLAIQKADGAEAQFRYTDETEVSGAQEGTAGLASMKGRQVTVHFTQEQGQMALATRIEVHTAQ